MRNPTLRSTVNMYENVKYWNIQYSKMIKNGTNMIPANLQAVMSHRKLDISQIGVPREGCLKYY